ncbi:hypothetical protein JQC92_04195 [Shewanella sp. 202IG2-18]|uniref:hypothetical protein n=1 Tax=Parashewanella hymeniacidonis TaxID=2807618 RepID=UPI0019622104|nr:hypothetical protein [Parashewanella hymeniacidonis]MBM7071244.1 hypothetical protein [Parashewanella hymeniacidonis]
MAIQRTQPLLANQQPAAQERNTLTTFFEYTIFTSGLVACGAMIALNNFHENHCDTQQKWGSNPDCQRYISYHGIIGASVVIAGVSAVTRWFAQQR